MTDGSIAIVVGASAAEFDHVKRYLSDTRPVQPSLISTKAVPSHDLLKQFFKTSTILSLSQFLTSQGGCFTL